MDWETAHSPAGPKFARSWLLICALIPNTIFAAEPADGSQSTNGDAIEAALRNDAALADVFFVDAATGWAVGDRGVIWHTFDGGNSWRQQHSGVPCRLNSVWFIDHRRGWAVGGAARFHGGATQAVVLRTADGGTTWQCVSGLLLPRLNRVKFFDPNVGVALGDSSSSYPSGVFATQDGGQSWRALAAEQATPWLAGDFIDPEAGAVTGVAGQFATIAQRRVMHSPLATRSLRSAHAMRLTAPASGWLVGDGGLVMATRDLGHSWQSPPGELPDNAGEHFDFHALAVHGPHVWVAGSPGTRVFHSADGGQSWQAFATGCFTPIRALSFVDAQLGWAVGDLGCICITTDGGRTWSVQRAGGLRAALLTVFAHATDVPLELIAEQGAAESYITAVEIVHGQPTANDRMHEAMLTAGAAVAETAWRFPLPPDDLALGPADLLAELNRTNDGRAVQQLQNHLVRQLRMWRPNVVVTHHATSETADPNAALVEQLVLRSVEAAADATQRADLEIATGLAPWQVEKVYGLLPPGAHGDESIATGRFSPWLGASLADWSASARRLLFATHTPPPDTIELRLLTGEAAGDHVASAGGKGGNRGLFTGIVLAHGSDARRPAPDLPLNNLDDLRHMATRRRHLQNLLQLTEGNAAWAAQITGMIDGLDADAGAELLSQLAEDYREKGLLDLAADSYYLLARRYPDHELAESALHWLVQFYASSEAAHRAKTAAVAWTLVRDDSPAERTEVRATAFDAPASASPAIGLSQDDRLRRAVQLADYLKTSRPALYAEPAIRFAEVAAQRELGYANEAKRYFLTLGQHTKTDPWRRCAETEQWLAQPGDGPPPKALAACRRAAPPPHLDGQLDEPLWHTADRLRLSSTNRLRLSALPDEAPAAEVRLAYDNEFLYLAISCPKSSGDYSPNSDPRPRDADLLPHDRVTLRLDIDRDFSTAFELTVDHRGWTHEACWGDASWDPTWYVAAGSDKTTWTVEAAVPLAELTARPPSAKHVWAASVRRTIPRVGYESWAGASDDADSPDQYGLVLFE